MTRKKNKDQNSWDDLTKTWQGVKGVDLDDIANHIRRKTLQMRLVFGSEVLACGLGFALGGLMIWRADSSFEFGFGIFIILFCIVGLYGAWWARRGIWHGTSETLRDQLELTLKRAQAGIKYADINLWLIIPATLLIAAVLYQEWDSILVADQSRQILIFVLLGFGAVTLIGTAIWARWYKKLKRNEITQIEALLKDMKDAP